METSDIQLYIIYMIRYHYKSFALCFSLIYAALLNDHSLPKIHYSFYRLFNLTWHLFDSRDVTVGLDVMQCSEGGTIDSIVTIVNTLVHATFCL